jgi:hypothetical protein
MAPVAAFVPDSQRWKNIEDVTKNINMFAQLHSAVFTAFFTDPLSAGMVYKRLGASWWKGVSLEPPSQSSNIYRARTS